MGVIIVYERGTRTRPRDTHTHSLYTQRMASFGKMSRETPDQLPHYGRKLITAEILSHEKEQCSFSPSLPPDGVRDKVRGGYTSYVHGRLHVGGWRGW